MGAQGGRGTPTLIHPPISALMRASKKRTIPDMGESECGAPSSVDSVGFSSNLHARSTPYGHFVYTVPPMNRTSIPVLILAVALVISACSNDGDSQQVASIETETGDTSQTTEPDPVADSEAGMLAFTQCLRDQGIDVDDPTVDADGNMQLPPIEIEGVAGADPNEAPDMSAFEELVAPCEVHLEGVVTTAGSGSPTEFEDALLAYAQCMRSHGVDIPDPDLSSDGGVIDLGTQDGEEFEAADEECRPLLAQLGIFDG